MIKSNNVTALTDRTGTAYAFIVNYGDNIKTI